MSLQLSKKAPSDCESQCPDCGATLSRRADMNRHRKSKHPNGTETKFRCPWFGCAYEAMQRGNLKTHLDARHSNGPKYPCQECDRRFTDAAARIRHRKRMHGYVPYHTQEYFARQALDRKERVLQVAGKAVSNESRHQGVVRAVTDDLPNASSSALPLAPKLPEVDYHDNYWKMFVDIAHSNPPQQYSQDVPISLPFPTVPGYDYNTPNAIQTQPFSMQSPAQLQLPLTPSDFTTDSDYSDLFGPQLYTMPSQEQTFGESFAGDHGVPPYNPYNGLWDWPTQQ